MTAETQPSLPPISAVESDSLPDLTRWMSVVIDRLEYEHSVRPERRFGHLVEQGKELKRRIFLETLETMVHRDNPASER
jgi:hypothetical protein